MKIEKDAKQSLESEQSKKKLESELLQVFVFRFYYHLCFFCGLLVFVSAICLLLLSLVSLTPMQGTILARECCEGKGEGGEGAQKSRAQSQEICGNGFVYS
jgi:hypothetical protein